jgi:hypothetical protein
MGRGAMAVTGKTGACYNFEHSPVVFSAGIMRLLRGTALA